MTDPDDHIDAALRAEERRLLQQIGDEPAFLDQVGGLFRTRNAWVNWLMIVSQTALFIVGAYAAWRFFQATDALTALRWGLPSGVLLLMSLIIKLSMWPEMQIQALRRDLVHLVSDSASRSR